MKIEGKKRPWYASRFTLRTSFLIISVIAVFACWIGLLAKKSNNQRRAAAAVLRIGGFVEYDHQHGKSYWSKPAIARPSFRKLHTVIPSRFNLKVRNIIRPWIGTHFVDNIVTVGFYDAQPDKPMKLTEEEWGYLQRLNKLKEVHMFGLAITDAEMPFISQLPNLRVILGGRNSGITDVGVECLHHTPTLEMVQLHSPQVTEEASNRLARRPNMRQVSFGP